MTFMPRFVQVHPFGPDLIRRRRTPRLAYRCGVCRSMPCIWAGYREEGEINPLNAELNPICYLLALLGAHYFLHVSRIRVKSLILRLLMLYIYIYIYIYIYGAPILDVSRSHTTTHHSR